MGNGVATGLVVGTAIELDGIEAWTLAVFKDATVEIYGVNTVRTKSRWPVQMRAETIENENF